MPINRVTTEGRDSFEIWVFLFIFVSMIPTIIGTGPPSIIATLPFPWYLVWAFMALLGSLGATVGLYMKKREIGLLIEQAALVPVAIAAGVYAIVVLSYSGISAGMTAGVYAALIPACWRRWRKIQRAFNEASEKNPR